MLSREKWIRDKALILHVYRFRGALIGQLSLCLLMLGISSAHADVTFLAKSNGFPGASASDEAVLTVSVRKSAMRVVNPARLHVVTVDLASDQFHEFLAYDKVYETKSVASFKGLRKKREEQRAKDIKAYHALRKEADKKATLKALRDEGIELSGKIVATLERSKVTKDYEIRVNGVLRRVKCRRVRIRENAALKPAFELWVTEELEIGESLLKFYQIGTFSKEVLSKLKEVKGFPVRIEAFVDTGSLKKRIHCEVRALEQEAVPDWYMAVPEGFKKVASLKTFLEDKKMKALGDLTCDDCGKALKDPKKATRWRRRGVGGKAYHFCNSKCRMTFMTGKKWAKKK